MKLRGTALLIALAFAIGISSLLTPVNNAMAAGMSSSLSIAPKKNYVINPGDSIEDTILIRNIDTTSALDLSLRVIDFSYMGEDGTPKLMLDPKAPQTTWSLKPYMTVPETTSIGAQQSKSLKIKVSMPENVGPGSYYSAIIYSSGSGGVTTGNNVGLSASGVTLVFVNVPGKVHEDLKIKKFGAYDITSGYKFIAFDVPKNMAYSLENKGNVAESPTGMITLKDMWGHTREINNVNPNGSLALIGQTRTFTTCIETNAQNVNFAGKKTEASQCATPGLWPGLYTAKIDLFYGQNGNNTQEIVRTATFWYLPWWFIVIVLVVLAVVSYFVWRAVRFVRRKLDGTQRGRRSSHRR